MMQNDLSNQALLKAIALLNLSTIETGWLFKAERRIAFAVKYQNNQLDK